MSAAHTPGQWDRLHYKYSHIGCPAARYEDNCAHPDRCADNGKCLELASEDETAPREYRRVYQGGHHDVWCNGEMHRKTVGGWCHPDNETVPPLGLNYGCDCAYWRQFP
jgi:hypothetical protein